MMDDNGNSLQKTTIMRLRSFFEKQKIWWYLSACPAGRDSDWRLAWSGGGRASPRVCGDAGRRGRWWWRTSGRSPRWSPGVPDWWRRSSWTWSAPTGKGFFLLSCCSDITGGQRQKKSRNEGLISKHMSMTAVLWTWIRNPHWFRLAGSRRGYRRAKMTHKNRKRAKKFHVLMCWLLSFEGFSCGLDVLHGGLGKNKFAFDPKNRDFFQL